MILVRFPDSSREFLVTDETFHVGAMLRHDGEGWTVASVDDYPVLGMAVTLVEAAEPGFDPETRRPSQPERRSIGCSGGAIFSPTAATGAPCSPSVTRGARTRVRRDVMPRVCREFGCRDLSQMAADDPARPCALTLRPETDYAPGAGRPSSNQVTLRTPSRLDPQRLASSATMVSP